MATHIRVAFVVPGGVRDNPGVHELVAFAAVAVVLILTPGPDMALVTRNTVAYGRRAGLETSAGVCAGVLVHGCAAALGLSAILRTSATAFTVVKIAGAAYLVYLGVQALWRSRAGAVHRETPLGMSSRRVLRAQISPLIPRPMTVASRTRLVSA